MIFEQNKMTNKGDDVGVSTLRSKYLENQSSEVLVRNLLEHNQIKSLSFLLHNYFLQFSWKILTCF